MSSVPCPKSIMKLCLCLSAFVFFQQTQYRNGSFGRQRCSGSVWRGREQECGDSSKYHTRWSRKSGGVGILLAPPGPWLSLSKHDCFHDFNSLCCSDSLPSQSLVEAEGVKCQVSSERLYLMVSSPSSSVGLNSSPPNRLLFLSCSLITIHSMDFRFIFNLPSPNMK